MAMQTSQRSPDALVEEAQRRGYLTIDGARITYHCKRDYRDNYNDPEEKVRARTYSWLIIDRSYSPDRIDVEVRVPRRTPNDFADIVVYQDDACRAPYLVVENKPEDCTPAEQRQAIEQGFGNTNSLRAPYMLFDYIRGSLLFDVGNFPSGEREHNRLGHRDALPENYGAPSQFALIAQGTTDIRPVSSFELEIKVRRAHGLIWAGGRRDPLKSFDEWSKLLFAKIYDERHTLNGRPRKFQCGIGETSTQVANRIRALYAEARHLDPSIFSDPNISLPDDKIKDVTQVIQEVGLSLMPVDGLGYAFEHFFGSIFRGDLGQYFTRRELVRFMVAMVRPTDRDFIIDPTCGSGGFLLEALMQVWHYIDANYAGQPDVERRKYDFAHENLFGIEIHDTLGRVCQTNLLLHKDGHTNIETDRSCLDTAFRNSQIKPDGSLFTLVLGNPPFGDKIRNGDTDTLGNNTLASFQMGQDYTQVKSELIILERAFEFLRPGGMLAMVVPDGILNNPGEPSQCPTFRCFLLRSARIDAIISLPDHAFRKSGAQNKTSILFATKYAEEEKARFEQEYAIELERLRQSTEHLGTSSSEFTIELVDLNDMDDEDGGALSAAALSEARLDARVIGAVLGRHQYPIFLAEADQIGYSPSGVTINKNDLYSIADGFHNPNDRETILGQYSLFQQAPNTYHGTITPQCMSIQASDLMTAHPTYRMDPKFHLFQRERFDAPPPGMKLIRLGDALHRRLERVEPTLHPDREFLVPTLTQEGELTPREAGQGRNPPAWFGQYFTGGSRWYVIHTDNLIYSQIDLWKGCVTIVPAQYDAAIVTQEFPIYEVDQKQLDPHYLKLVLRSKYFQRAIRAITTGHSNRRRTQSYDFENLTIFAPEQKDTQIRISDTVRESEQAVSLEQAEYRQLLLAIDRLIIGEIQPKEILDKSHL